MCLAPEDHHNQLYRKGVPKKKVTGRLNSESLPQCDLAIYYVNVTRYVANDMTCCVMIWIKNLPSSYASLEWRICLFSAVSIRFRFWYCGQAGILLSVGCLLIRLKCEATDRILSRINSHSSTTLSASKTHSWQLEHGKVFKYLAALCLDGTEHSKLSTVQRKRAWCSLIGIESKSALSVQKIHDFSFPSHSIMYISNDDTPVLNLK